MRGWREDPVEVVLLGRCIASGFVLGGHLTEPRPFETPVQLSCPVLGQALANTELGFDTFNNGVADEPLLAIAVVQYGIAADPRDANISVSLLGLQGEPSLDIDAGVAEFAKNGRPVRSAVIHFAAEYSEPASAEGEHYRRIRQTSAQIARSINTVAIRSLSYGSEHSTSAAVAKPPYRC